MILQILTNAARRLGMGILVFVLCGLISIESLAVETSSSPLPIGLGIVEQAQFPNPDADIMGLRFSLGYNRNANVSGLDFGLFGCGVDGFLFGLQFSVLLNNIGSANGALQLSGIANNCLEDFNGIQIASIANKVDGNVYGMQLALFNIANDMSGTQIGVYNQANNALGIQIGVINMANDMKGIQLGVCNVIKNGLIPYMIILNANF